MGYIDHSKDQAQGSNLLLKSYLQDKWSKVTSQLKIRSLDIVGGLGKQHPIENSLKVEGKKDLQIEKIQQWSYKKVEIKLLMIISIQ